MFMFLEVFYLSTLFEFFCGEFSGIKPNSQKKLMPFCRRYVVKWILFLLRQGYYFQPEEDGLVARE